MPGTKKYLRNALRKNNEEGITLIALIITIVILIILASVTINIAFGEGGIIKRAEETKNLTEQVITDKQENINSLFESMEDLIQDNENPENLEYTEYTDIYVTGYLDGTLAFSSTNTKLDGKEEYLEYGNVKDYEFKVTYNYDDGEGADMYTEISANTPWIGDSKNYTTVVFVDKIVPSSVAGWFFKFESLTTIQNIENLNTENVSDFSAMFAECRNIASLDMSKLNTSNATNMSWMFGRCERLTTLNIKGLDTSKVTDMANMFDTCGAITNLDVSDLNTSNVEDMHGMFERCYDLQSLDLSNFNTSKVKNMSIMFAGSESLKELNLSSFDTSKVMDMSYMFGWCTSLKSITITKDKWVFAAGVDRTDMMTECPAQIIEL